MPTGKIPVAYASRRLAEARGARALTQSELARQVGVSRQFLNQMETGRVLPNVAIALRLAATLGETVEALFAPVALTANLIEITLASPAASAGSRLWLGRVEGRWVAYAADTAGSLAAGFAAADAILRLPHQAELLVPAARASGNLLVAGCDPALALLASAAPGASAARCYHWIDCASGHALDLLASGLVHVAGIHYAGADGRGNVQELQVRDPERKWSLVRFTRWEQGWLVRAGGRRPFAGLDSLASGTWRLANRDESAAARRWLDRELARHRIAPAGIPGYGEPVPSAAAGAQAVAEARADVAVGPQALAPAFGLHFVPAEAVDFDLVAPVKWWNGDEGRELVGRVRQLAGAGVLAQLPGYAAIPTGVARSRGRRRSPVRR